MKEQTITFSFKEVCDILGEEAAVKAGATYGDWVSRHCLFTSTPEGVTVSVLVKDGVPE